MSNLNSRYFFATKNLFS